MIGAGGDAAPTDVLQEEQSAYSSSAAVRQHLCCGAAGYGAAAAAVFHQRYKGQGRSSLSTNPANQL